MANYKKIDGKILEITKEIDVSKKLLALADTKKQIEQQLIDCEAEIETLNSLK